MLRALARQLFGESVVGAPRWWERLQERGMDPFVLSALRRHAELIDAWEQAPRVDWVVAIAVLAPVGAPVLRRGLEGVLTHCEGWPRSEARAALEALAVDLAAYAQDPDAVDLDAIGPALLRLVDDAPEVTSALAEVRQAARWRNRERLHRASDAYDETHAAAHAGLSSAFRRAVPFEAVRVALEDRKAHPYR